MPPFETNVLVSSTKRELISNFELIGQTSVMNGFVITTAFQPRQQNSMLAKVAAFAKRSLNAE